MDLTIRASLPLSCNHFAAFATWALKSASGSKVAGSVFRNRLSSSAHAFSMGFKSGEAGGQNRRESVPIAPRGRVKLNSPPSESDRGGMQLDKTDMPPWADPSAWTTTRRGTLGRRLERAQGRRKP